MSFVHGSFGSPTFGFPFYGSIVITISRQFPFVTISFKPPVCFASGTLIRTTRGDVAVENLVVGDMAVTSSGATRPIVWLGHRRVDCRQDEASSNWPVRIARDALGPSKPQSDLYVSPGHAICFDVVGEVLIIAGSLVNGSTVARVEVDEITYWHVELESHDILIANGVPAESYIDMGNRSFFVEGGAQTNDADAKTRTHADYCRPLHIEGDLVDVVRAQVTARASTIGWVQDREADLRLVVDGKDVKPFVAGDTAILVFPAEAKDVRLSTKSFVPAENGGQDERRLGLSVRGLSVSATDGEPRRLSLDEPALADAFHAAEREEGQLRRWTKGDIVLPRELWDGLAGQVALHLSFESSTPRGWIAPPKNAEESLPPLRIVA